MTRETLGIWSTTKGVTANMNQYKLDDYVCSVPLFAPIRPANSISEGMVRGRYTPVGFGTEHIEKLFEEIKPFLLENPIYLDVLQTEIDGYGNSEDALLWHSERSCVLKKLTNIFNDVEIISNIRTTWNNIRMVWYLKNIHENIKPVWEFDNIIDFGAGTGHFIKHCYQVGFSGSVQIIDLPEAILLQRYVLRGLNVVWVDTEEVSTRLPNSLFNSTWGFSEIPISLRNKLPDISSCSKFIAYQHKYHGIDNKKDILDRFYKEGSSILRDISYLVPWDSGSTFLMGKALYTPTP
jgi:hypothetical protein